MSTFRLLKVVTWRKTPSDNVDIIKASFGMEGAMNISQQIGTHQF
jgi:hypothetical protein